MADYGYFKDIKGNKKYINDDSIYHEGKNLRDVINSKANSSNVYNKTEIDTKINANEKYTLYENTSGSTGNLVLSDSRENYDYIKVFVDFGEYVTSAETNTNKICISGFTLNEDGIYTKMVILSFNGINCTKVSNYSAVNRANEYNRYETDAHKVIKILGYK